ncbi:hypothetical protein DKAM_1462 [Desulfurococcus amylolyticus 1221n]|uniref:Uncharacterized protein n=2 Tax=Desulfurococcus amylolyticus TaxID=94694 RepID=B8D6Q7_DESA1|nr:hypothetical protein DKAM_1462 [Desulfurococcus amylolyticus 1221n]
MDAMSTTPPTIEGVVRTLTILSQNIKSQVIERHELDSKSITLISSLRKIVDDVAVWLDQVDKRLKAEDVKRGVTRLASYTYLIIGKSEIVVMRSKPEYIIVSVNLEKNSISIKTRNTILLIEPGRIYMRVKGVSVEIDPLKAEDYISKRDELVNALRVLGKNIDLKVSQLIEQYVSKKAG